MSNAININTTTENQVAQWGSVIHGERTPSTSSDEVVRFHGKHKTSDDLNRNPEIHRSIGAILPCYDDGAKRDQGTT